MHRLDEDTQAAYARAVKLMEGTGITFWPALMVLFCMVYDPGLTYGEALEIWAEVKGYWPPERWNSEICYAFLKAGIEQHPRDFLGVLIENGGLHNDENGVPIRQGG